MAEVTPIRRYTAIVRDPATGTTATYRFNALSERNADVQARDGFCGLLAVDQEQRARLEVVLEDEGEI